MEKLTLLFEEYVIKSIVQTEQVLACDNDKLENLDGFVDNRDRLLMIIGQIANQIDWNQVPNEKREELNRQIDYIKKLDEKLLTKLQEHREFIKGEIEKTHRQKENIKGYNLSDVK